MDINLKYQLYVDALNLLVDLLDKKFASANPSARLLRVIKKAHARFARRHNLFLETGS